MTNNVKMKCASFVIHYLVILLAFLEQLQYVISHSSFPIALMISMDALRYDKIDDCLTPNLYKLRHNGSWAPYLENVFPTKTFPNHHTIATGVYPEIHGVLDNSVYIAKDPCGSKSVVGYSYELFHANDEVIPLWTVNQQAGLGRHSGVMMWPSGDFPFGERRTIPTFWRKAAFNVSFEARIDEVVRWFTHPTTPANLVFMYFEEPDLHGHSYGIESEKVRQQLTRLDNATAYLIHRLAANGLHNVVNIFLFSDHGMVDTKRDRVVNLDAWVNPDLYIAASTSPALQIFPKQGAENTVMTGLLEAQKVHPETFDVYKIDEIPKRWHYAGSTRAPPILAVAREGYFFQDFLNNIADLEKRFHIPPNPNNPHGIHGYDNARESMRPFFMAWGPNIKPEGRIEPFQTVQLFPTWAKLLGLSVAELAGPFADSLTFIVPSGSIGLGSSAALSADPLSASVETKTESPEAEFDYVIYVAAAALTLTTLAVFVLFIQHCALSRSRPLVAVINCGVQTDPRLRRDVESQYLLSNSECEDS